MATSTIADEAILSGLLRDSLSPIDTLGQGMLAMAIRRKATEDENAREQRLRQQQLEDEARRRGERLQDMDRSERLALESEVRARNFAKEQEAAQFAHQEKMVGIHAEAQAKAAVDQFNRLSEADKKQRTENALAEARAAGVTKEQLPDNASFADIQVALAQSRGRRLVESARTVAQTANDYAAAHGQTAKEVTANAMRSALANVSPQQIKKAKMDPNDLATLLAKPEAISELEVKYLRAKNTEAYAILAQVNAAVADQFEKGMKDAEASKPYLAGLSNRFKAANEDLQALRKQGGYDEASSIEASRSLIQTSFGKPPPNPLGADQELTPDQVRAAMKRDAQGRVLGPTGAPLRVQPGAAAPAPVAPRPSPGAAYDLLQQQMRSEAGVPGQLLPSAVASSGQPLTDQWYDALASRVGVQPQGVGSSILQTPAGSVLRRQMATNPQLTASLNAISDQEANSMALTVLSKFSQGLPANSPTKLRLAKALQDLAGNQNAVAPTAYGGVTFFPEPTQ